MTAFQQKNAKKAKNVFIEMQKKKRFERYHGRIRFKPNYRLFAVKGGTVVMRKVTGGFLVMNYF